LNELFNRSDILNTIQGLNPWWANRSYNVPDFRRIASVACRKHLKDTASKRAVLLSGPRHVGKTTVLLQIAADLVKSGKDPKSVFYISLEHPLLKLLSIRQILSLYGESVYPMSKPVYLLFDEIQYSNEWEAEIKLLIDHRPNCRIIAAGSAGINNREHLVEKGTDRWVYLPVSTLSFYEFIHLRGEDEPDISHSLKPSDLFSFDQRAFLDLALRFRELQPSFQQYLLIGGFPETALLKNIDICQRMLREDISERVLKRDIAALFGVRKIAELEKLFIYLCFHSGSIIAHKTCADALGTSPATVSSHFSLFEQANLIYRLPPAKISGKKFLKTRNKYYLADAALRNAVLLRGEEIMTNPEEMEFIAETTVFRHLYSYYFKEVPKIEYWRNPVSQKEVDVIVKSRGHTIPFDVKYQEKPNLSSTSGLVAFCSIIKVMKAYWITKLDSDFGVTEFEGVENEHGRPTEFLKIPAHILCYLLGQAEESAYS
jgi:uncharacterized protein